MSECTHPENMKGAWTEYLKDTKWAIGWCCAACGHVERTGEAPNKPHWAVKPTA